MCDYKDEAKESKREVWTSGISELLFDTSPMPIYPIKSVSDSNTEISYQNYMEIRNGKLILIHPDTKEEMTVTEPLELIRNAFKNR